MATIIEPHAAHTGAPRAGRWRSRRALLRELECGRRVQAHQYAARTVRGAGWEAAARLHPAEALAGDFIVLSRLPGDRLLVAVGDVAGKGAGPALVGAAVAGALRTSDPADGAALGRLVTRLNADLIAETPDELFVTLFAALLDPAAGVLYHLSAGHPPALLSNGGRVERLGAGGPLLGVVPDADYQVGRAALRPGTRLLAYSDGVTEVVIPGGWYGIGRLEEAFARRAAAPASRLLDGLAADLADACGGRDFVDDVTLAVVTGFTDDVVGHWPPSD